MTIKIFAIATFSLFSCFRNEAKKAHSKIEPAIRCIKITRDFPHIDSNGHVLKYSPNETKIYFYEGQVLYQTYYYFAKITNEKEAESPNEKFVYYNFLYDRSKTHGILYDSNKSETLRIVRVDSMLAKEWAATINFNLLFRENHTKLTSRKKTAVGEMECFYSFINKKDTSMKGELLLSFSKKRFNDIDYSLSREIDSLNKMKLFKVVMINYERFIRERNFHIDRIEVPYVLEEILVVNKEEILKLFDLERQTIFKG